MKINNDTQQTDFYRHVSSREVFSSLPRVLNELKSGFGQQREPFMFDY